MDFVYSCLNFGSIVLPYRLLVGSQFAFGDTVIKTLLAGSVFFFGLTAFVLLRYPDSLVDKVWVAIRGMVAGILLMIALTEGMLM